MRLPIPAMLRRIGKSEGPVPPQLQRHTCGSRIEPLFRSDGSQDRLTFFGAELHRANLDMPTQPVQHLRQRVSLIPQLEALLAHLRSRELRIGQAFTQVPIQELVQYLAFLLTKMPL